MNVCFGRIYFEVRVDTQFFQLLKLYFQSMKPISKGLNQGILWNFVIKPPISTDCFFPMSSFQERLLKVFFNSLAVASSNLLVEPDHSVKLQFFSKNHCLRMRFPRTPGLFVSARFSVRVSTFDVAVMYSILFIHDIQREKRLESRLMPYDSYGMTLIVLTIFGSTRTNFGFQVSLKMRIMLFLSVTIATLLVILILMHCFNLFLRS